VAKPVMYWGTGTPWKTESKFWSWVRSGLRKAAWNRHPIKLNKKKANRYRAPIGRGGREVWACKCEMCGVEGPQDGYQVDHMKPAGSLKSVEDIQPFVERLLFVTEEDLRIVCKWCNSVLAYADRYHHTFEEALARKIEIRDKPKKKRSN